MDPDQIFQECRAGEASSGQLRIHWCRVERGNSDESGSTIRTLFIVAMITVIVPLITVALIRIAGVAADKLGVVPLP